MHSPKFRSTANRICPTERVVGGRSAESGRGRAPGPTIVCDLTYRAASNNIILYQTSSVPIELEKFYSVAIQPWCGIGAIGALIA